MQFLRSAEARALSSPPCTRSALVRARTSQPCRLSKVQFRLQASVRIRVERRLQELKQLGVVHGVHSDGAERSAVAFCALAARAQHLAFEVSSVASRSSFEKTFTSAARQASDGRIQLYSLGRSAQGRGRLRQQRSKTRLPDSERADAR